MITKTHYTITPGAAEHLAWQTYVRIRGVRGEYYFTHVAEGPAYDSSEEARKATLATARKYARAMYGDRLA